MSSLLSLKKNQRNYTLVIVKENGDQEVFYLFWGTSRNFGRCLKPKNSIKKFWSYHKQIDRFWGKIYSAERCLEEIGDIYYFNKSVSRVNNDAVQNEQYHKVRGGC